jgi:hypothetical protein
MLALLQTLLIIIGFFVLGAVLKFSGYPDEIDLRWNPLAVFLREYGFWLLGLPALWTCFALSAQGRDRGFFSYAVACVFGLAIAGVTIATFIWAAIFPYARPLLMPVQ